MVHVMPRECRPAPVRFGPWAGWDYFWVTTARYWMCLSQGAWHFKSQPAEGATGMLQVVPAIALAYSPKVRCAECVERAGARVQLMIFA